MSPARLTIDQINALDHAPFVATLGFAFEQSPWVAAQAWAARPFADLAQLHRAMCAAMYAAPLDQQLALIRAHPDLAGKAAIAGELTAESTSEQASVGLDRLTPEEYAEFMRRNTAYRERFGFPFIICVREHTKTSILQNFAVRLNNSPAQETQTALDEIAKIAFLRLSDRVAGQASG